MIAVLRIILVLVLSVGICVFGIVYCLVQPFHPRHVAVFSRLFGRMAPIFGIQVEIRNKLGDKLPKQCVYIVNHQNNYDMVTVSYVVPSHTITIGKRSLLWIPFFGQLYWISGNILINRTQNVREYGAFIQRIVKIIKTRGVSVWMFPEGTRSRGRGLLPFKTGAFYIAISAKIPIVPVCVSNISNKKIQLNRWFNGLVIIEVMDPIETRLYQLNQARFLTEYCRNIMKMKLNKLNKEVTIREA